jgi:uncharacterized Tic20 family protein
MEQENPSEPPVQPAAPPSIIDVHAVEVPAPEPAPVPEMPATPELAMAAAAEPMIPAAPEPAIPAMPLIPPPILPERSTPTRTWKQHVWAVLCHLMLFLVIPTVFLGAVITFFLWQIKGRRDPQVEDQGREALNFQINVAVLTALLGITFFGIPLVPIVWFVAGIFCVIAARKAAEGVNYRYPWILRVVTH